MALDQYFPEVQDRLATHLATGFNPKNKRWAVWLDPHTVWSSKPGLLPPGQGVYVGGDDYGLEYRDLVCDPCSPFDLEAMLDRYEKLYWAVIPRFKTYESAMQKGMHWLNHERPDLVRASIQETQEALAYRAARINKGLKP